jgi:hypothetical protein
MPSERLEAVVPLDSMGGTRARRDVYARITVALREEEDRDGTKDRG